MTLYALYDIYDTYVIYVYTCTLAIEISYFMLLENKQKKFQTPFDQFYFYPFPGLPDELYIEAVI